MQVDKHPLIHQCFELTLAIAKCGASPEREGAVTQSTELMKSIYNFLDSKKLLPNTKGDFETVIRKQREPLAFPGNTENKDKHIGSKYDQDKPRWDLLPWDTVRQIVDVLTFGAKKYAPDNWQHVDDARNRYFAAAQRHLTAWFSGEKTDPESGLHHLAHAACCVLFLLWFDNK